MLPVQLLSFRLDVWPIWTTLGEDASLENHSLIGGNSRPLKTPKNTLDGSGDGTLLIGILNAQEKFSFRFSGEEPRVESRTQSSDVERARWRGCEASTHSGERGNSFLAS